MAKVIHSRASRSWMTTELAMMKRAKRTGARSCQRGSKEKTTLRPGARRQKRWIGFMPAQ